MNIEGLELISSYTTQGFNIWFAIIIMVVSLAFIVSFVIIIAYLSDLYIANKAYRETFGEEWYKKQRHNDLCGIIGFSILCVGSIIIFNIFGSGKINFATSNMPTIQYYCYKIEDENIKQLMENYDFVSYDDETGIICIKDKK